MRRFGLPCALLIAAAGASAQTAPSPREAAAYAGAHAAAWRGDAAALAAFGKTALEARDRNGRTPLQLARARGYAAMAAMLEAASR